MENRVIVRIYTINYKIMKEFSLEEYIANPFIILREE